MTKTIPGLVSTIIPVFNREEMVVRAIDSVLAQTHRPIEIIVVDDGSTDNTLQVLNSKSKLHPEITIVAQENAGPGVARETGRLLAQGEYIQYLDSDDVLLLNKFALQILALKKTGADISYGKTERLAEGDTPRGKVLKRTGEQHRHIFPLSLRERWWSTSSPLFKRDVVDKAGSWLPLINEEDWAYDCQMGALNAKLVYVDEFVTLIYEHDDHLSVQGTVDPHKLKHRAIARKSMYQSALGTNTPIKQEDFQFFSKSVFLLARECADAGLKEESMEMLELSIQAHGSQRLKHWVFKWLLKLFGCKGAVFVTSIIQ